LSNETLANLSPRFSSKGIVAVGASIPERSRGTVPGWCQSVVGPEPLAVRFDGRIRSGGRGDPVLEREDAAKPAPPAIIQGGLP